MEKYQAYYNNIHILYTVNDSFRKRIDEISAYRKGVMPKITPVMNGELVDMDWTDKNIHKLMEEFNLPKNYLGALLWYTDENDEPWLYFPDEKCWPKVIIDEDGFKRFAIEVTPETTLNDFKENWELIQESIKRYYKEYSTKFPLHSRNSFRDIEIYRLKKEKKTAKEITRIINDKYPSTPIEYQEVPKLVKRLEQRAKKIIGGK